MTEGDVQDRLDRLESLVDRQQTEIDRQGATIADQRETIERQREWIAELERRGFDDASQDRPVADGTSVGTVTEALGEQFRPPLWGDVASTGGQYTGAPPAIPSIRVRSSRGRPWSRTAGWCSRHRMPTRWGCSSLLPVRASRRPSPCIRWSTSSSSSEDGRRGY